ncbi:hypothetical protein [Chamaesiphon sp. OTE_75_metabat_556]|uniref:hypothetical protein n=1 Tax=Chamaesiphon sp. OTE_75_metabat_556 TaxID=2964692 RepID=UPI00286CEF86|nr:hypothetical protein [Chamaesiphon sp. OTE_75_metabat_556]
MLKNIDADLKFGKLIMSNINLANFILCSTTAMFSLSIGSNLAQASFVCPNGPGPGERQIGITGGSHGVAAILLCEEIPQSGDGNNSRESSSPVSRYYDPKLAALKFQSAATMVNVLQQARLLQDPKYVKYISGSWNLFPTSRLAGVKPGNYCAASFFKASMDPEAKKAPIMIDLLGPGGDYKGALLTFAAEAIPRPKTMKTITVTLIQNNEPPATVKAFNYTMPKLPFGVIAFAVPTIDAALAGMEDVQNFDVKIDGKSVAKTMWHSGLKMKDEFRKCLNGQPYSVTEIDIVPERLKTQSRNKRSLDC